MSQKKNTEDTKVEPITLRADTVSLISRVLQNPGYVKNPNDLLSVCLFQEDLSAYDLEKEEEVTLQLSVSKFQAVKRAIEAAIKEGHLGCGADLVPVLRAFNIGKQE